MLSLVVAGMTSEIESSPKRKCEIELCIFVKRSCLGPFAIQKDALLALDLQPGRALYAVLGKAGSHSAQASL